MSPFNPPNPDDIGAAAPFISKIKDSAVWLGGIIAALLAVFYKLVQYKGLPGEVQSLKKALASSTHENAIVELREDLKNKVSVKDMPLLQEACREHLARQQDLRMYEELNEVKKALNYTNANLFLLMGAQNIQPIKPPPGEVLEMFNENRGGKQ